MENIDSAKLEKYKEERYKKNLKDYCNSVNISLKEFEERVKDFYLKEPVGEVR